MPHIPFIGFVRWREIAYGFLASCAGASFGAGWLAATLVLVVASWKVVHDATHPAKAHADVWDFALPLIGGAPVILSMHYL